jgi:hypothetical protein
MHTRAVAFFLLGLSLTAVSVAEMRITTNDGRQIQGDVVKTPDGNYTITTKYAVFTLPADKIKSIEEILTPQQEYKQRLAKIDPKSAEAHYELARWAIQSNLLKEAQAELKGALALRPDYEQASLLLRQVEAKLAAAETAFPSQQSSATSQPAIIMGLRPEWLIGREDIYRIRATELRGNEQVMVNFRGKAVEDFIKLAAGKKEFSDPNFAKTFRSWPPVKKASYMLEFLEQNDPNDTAIRPNILIESDPKVMLEFRTKVWPIILQQCATPQCHGGNAMPGGLRLFRGGAGRPDVMYTNFVILDGFGAAKRVINRDQPEQSLLLQYGLPADIAQDKHPVKLPMIFNSTETDNYKTVLNWIKSLKTPHPNYNLKYEPPFGMKLQNVGTAAAAAGATGTANPANPTSPATGRAGRASRGGNAPTPTPTPAP